MPSTTPDESTPPAKKSPHRLGIGGVYDERARVAGIAEAVSAERDLAGEELGQIWLCFGAILEVIDGDIDIDGGNGAAGKSRRPAALRHLHCDPGRLALAAGRGDSGRCRSQRAVRLARAELKNCTAGIDHPGAGLGEGSVGIGLRGAEREPGRERGDGCDARTQSRYESGRDFGPDCGAVWRTVVVDQAGLDDGLAVSAWSLRARTWLLLSRNCRPALSATSAPRVPPQQSATDAPCASRSPFIAARAAQRNGPREGRAVLGRIARNTGWIEQNRHFGLCRARASRHISHLLRVNDGRSGVSDSTGGKGLSRALALRGLSVPASALPARVKWIAVWPPASASRPVSVIELPAARATFSGVSGSRNPGVIAILAVAETSGFEASRAITTTSALSAVRNPGGVYWPDESMLPGPALGSPPETDQITLAGVLLAAAPPAACAEKR